MALSDFGSILRSGQAVVPDYARNEAQRRLLAMQEQQSQLAATQEARLGEAQAFKMAAERDEMARRDRFGQAFEAVIDDPNQNGILGLYAQFPEYSDEIKKGWDLLDANVQRSTQQGMAELAFLLKNGRHDEAAANLKRRIDADIAADGQADPADQAILEDIQSGDEARRRSAFGRTVFAYASTIDPQNRKSALEALGLSLEPQRREIANVVYDDVTGQAIYQGQPEIISGVGGIFQREALPGVPGATQGGGRSSTSSAPPQSAQPSSGAPLGPQIEQVALSAVPGLTADNVTSRQRSPGKNDAVGGVANSYHLSDNARDFVPPRGMSMGQLAARLKQAMPGFDVINEGDHVHVEPRSRSQAGPVQIRSTQEYNRLPKGAQFYDPQGNLRTKS
jgi:hypothetical protein